jgi:abortive infection bacteriophage resistance protein
MQYAKPALSIADQITKLSSRGLIISDVQFAESKLKTISYYRLRAYTFPFQDNSNPEHTFIFKISFEDIIKFYEFDRNLRILVFNAIERIEIALRTLIIYNFAMSYGSHWFENKTLYRNNDYFNNDIAVLDKEINRSDEEFIKHYKSTYTNPLRPAAWMILEVATLTTLSKLFQNLCRCPEKKRVAKSLGIDFLILENWMHVLSNIRNICAHHSRLYNRTFSQSIIIPSYTYENLWLSNKEIDNSKIYAIICVMVYLFDSILPEHDFRAQIFTLFENYPGINPSLLHFPNNWQNDNFWKIGS